MGKQKQRRAVIYARISDDKRGQAEGVDLQLRNCRKLAAREGLEVVAELVDNSRSASSYARKPRAAWLELLAMLERREVDAVLATYPDRLYRKLDDLQRLVDALEGGQVEVRTINAGRIDLSTAAGRLSARTLATVSAYESEIKSERIRDKELDKASKGLPSGGGVRCYGYSRDGREIVPDEAAVIRDAVDRVLAGDSLTAIAKRLNGDGRTTSTGGKWRMGTLRRVLTAWRIAGIREHHGQLYPAVWPGIVERATLERVRSVLLDPERKVTRPSPRVSPLRGLAFCGECGEKLITASHGDGGTARRIYRCGRRPAYEGCGGISVRAVAVESEVFARVGAVLAGPGLADALARVSGGVAGHETASAELVGARQRLDDLSAEYWTRGRIGKGEFERRRSELEQIIGQLEREISVPSSTRHLTALPSDAAGIEAALAEMPPATAYALLRLVIRRIVIGRGKPGRFDAERVRIEWAS